MVVVVGKGVGGTERGGGGGGGGGGKGGGGNWAAEGRAGRCCKREPEDPSEPEVHKHKPRAPGEREPCLWQIIKQAHS